MELDLCLKQNYNTLPIAAYLDSDGWPELCSLKRPNVNSYRTRCPVTVAAAKGLHFSVLPGYTYGLEVAAKEWITFIAGSPGKKTIWCNGARRTIGGYFYVPLRECDLIGSMCGPYPSVATSTRFSNHYKNLVEEMPDLPRSWEIPSVSHIRFDIDMHDGWNGNAAAKISKGIKHVGDSIGLQTRMFASGRRGIHAVFAFPSLVTNQVSTALAALIRICLENELGFLGKVDADSTSSLTRLPGGNHADGKKCALFIDPVNRCFYDHDMQAQLLTSGLGWMPNEQGLFLSTKDFCAFVFDLDQELQNLGVQPMVTKLSNGIETQIIGNLSSPSTCPILDAAANALRHCPQVPSSLSPSEKPHTSTSSDRHHDIAVRTLENLPQAGETANWMKGAYGGVWACSVLYGDKGLKVLLDILRNVPASSEQVHKQRESSAKSYWKKFKYIPQKSRKRQSHPADLVVLDKVEQILKSSPRTYNHRTGKTSGKIDSRLSKNISRMVLVLLYSLRESGGQEFLLSTKNASSIFSKMYPNESISPDTVGRIMKLLEDVPRTSHVRTGAYPSSKDNEFIGTMPLVPMFEKQPGTTSRYKPSEWLKEILDEHQKDNLL